MRDVVILILALFVSGVIVAAVMAFVWIGSAWAQTLAAAAPVSLVLLFNTWLRRIPVHETVTAYVIAFKAGASVPFERFAELRAAGGNPIRAATMLAAMKYAGFPHEPGQVLRMEQRGALEGYLRAWQRNAAHGQAPPPLPDEPDN